MAFFKKPGRFSGRKGGDRGGNRFGDKPRFGGAKSGGFRGGDDRRGGFGGRSPAQLFKATCAECGNDCEVPFRPTGEKPVYCLSCFNGSKGGGSRDFKPRDREPSRSHKSSFSSPMPDKRIDEIKLQLDAIQLKMNDILQRLTVYKIDDVIKHQAEEKTAPKKETKTRATSKKKAAAKKK